MFDIDCYLFDIGVFIMGEFVLGIYVNRSLDWKGLIGLWEYIDMLNIVLCDEVGMGLFFDI